MHAEVDEFNLHGVVSAVAQIAAPLIEQNGNWLEFQVIDHGVGIPREQMQKIFQPFYQIDISSHRRAGGTGLGLAITKQFCELLGGYIRVESEPDAGSRFTILLPQDINNATSLPSGKLRKSA